MKKVFLFLLLLGCLSTPRIWAAEELEQAEATADLLVGGQDVVGPVVEVAPRVEETAEAVMLPAVPVASTPAAPVQLSPVKVASPVVVSRSVTPQPGVAPKVVAPKVAAPQTVVAVDPALGAESLIIPSVEGARVVKVPGLGLEPTKAETLQDLQRDAIEYSKPEPKLSLDQVDAALGVVVAEETKKETVVEIVEKKRAELIEATGDLVGAPLPPAATDIGMPGIGEAESVALVEKSLSEKPVGAVEPEPAGGRAPVAAAPVPPVVLAPEASEAPEAPVAAPTLSVTPPAAAALTVPAAPVAPVAPAAPAIAPDAAEGGEAIPFRVIPMDTYASFVKNWGNDEEPYYAVIRTPAQWEGAFAPAAVMGNDRLFMPPDAFFDQEQLLVVARVVTSGGEGTSLAAKSLQRSGDGQEFVYTYTPQQVVGGDAAAPYMLKDVLLVAAPKDYTGPFYFVEETLE